jgi:signal transduction histidine kinase
MAMIAALYQLARLDSGGREWVLTLIDATVAAIALSALVWNAFAHDLLDSFAGAPWWQGVIATIYPILDIAAVTGLLILVMRRSNYHFDLRLVFFALGGCAQVLADFVFLHRNVGTAFSNAEPAWSVNLVATAFLLVTASIVDKVPRKREFPEAPTPIWALMWPYLLAVSLVAVHFRNYRDLNPAADEVVLLDAVILIGVVILFRQVYVILRDRNRVDRKRAELVASVSHELRTPLTAMVGFLALLDEHPEEFPVDARREMISEAADQARHMSRLVGDLLMLAKGESSQLSLELREVWAMAILYSVLQDTDPRSKRVEKDLDAEVRVRVDPDRVRQALSNLVNNAIRYGGNRCVVVSFVQGDDLVFEVHDNGEGVPTRFETTIWQHFERGAHRLDATSPGLGIGLSIVQAVAESHGGTARYRTSERLGGACFYLILPDCVVREVPAPVEAPT